MGWWEVGVDWEHHSRGEDAEGGGEGSQGEESRNLTTQPEIIAA